MASFPSMEPKNKKLRLLTARSLQDTKEDQNCEKMYTRHRRRCVLTMRINVKEILTSEIGRRLMRCEPSMRTKVGCLVRRGDTVRRCSWPDIIIVLANCRLGELDSETCTKINEESTVAATTRSVVLTIPSLLLPLLDLTRRLRTREFVFAFVVYRERYEFVSSPRLD